MQTDIPLKTLTRIRPADLLPLLGSPDATVLGVESLELPSVATALDTLLRLRSARGTVYLHLVEWQGYKDPLLLWRALGYLADLGKRYPGLVIVVTLVYLHPGDDVGFAIRQVLDDQEVWSIQFRVIRLWEQDAAAAVASNLPGLAALSPLMRGASAALVERAASVVVGQEESVRDQADLLTILGIFAEPLMRGERFARVVGRERLMASDLITYLFGDRIAEAEREFAARADERVARAQEQAQEQAARAQEQAARAQEQAARAQEQAIVVELMALVEDTVIARFPNTPIAAIAPLRALHDIERLRTLHGALLRASDQASAERLLQEV